MEWVFLLIAAVPGLEARASTVYFVCSHSYYWIPLAIVINFIAVVAFIKIIDRFHVPDFVERLLRKRMRKNVDRVERWFTKYGDIAIFLLIALPANGVGSFSGAFIGRVFGLRGFWFYASVLAAIALSLIPAFFVGYGISLLGIHC